MNFMMYPYHVLGYYMNIKIFSGKLNANKLTNTGAVTGSKGGSYESPSHDRLVYVTTCLIGHQVEVQLKNGSIYNGIFHVTNTDKDFGCCYYHGLANESHHDMHKEIMDGPHEFGPVATPSEYEAGSDQIMEWGE
ncbi:H/ACA ribonucleoprotein complex subunit 2-like protein isoform C [Glycine soja]|uniref:H/ACA ribonucleoprotein complex subunit 2-like protein isoform C n=1 Tax=Glycine soja TaxID=3848 RepID=A0A445KIT7_GLYSO|nr:H/ACA ribonucleoprotein complex subunit 2-like protein isoform C [Glycine soja]